MWKMGPISVRLYHDARTAEVIEIQKTSSPVENSSWSSESEGKHFVSSTRNSAATFDIQRENVKVKGDQI